MLRLNLGRDRTTAFYRHLSSASRRLRQTHYCSPRAISLHHLPRHSPRAASAFRCHRKRACDAAILTFASYARQQWLYLSCCARTACAPHPRTINTATSEPFCVSILPITLFFASRRRRTPAVTPPLTARTAWRSRGRNVSHQDLLRCTHSIPFTLPACHSVNTTAAWPFPVTVPPACFVRHRLGVYALLHTCLYLRTFTSPSFTHHCCLSPCLPHSHFTTHAPPRTHALPGPATTTHALLHCTCMPCTTNSHPTPLARCLLPAHAARYCLSVHSTPRHRAHGLRFAHYRVIWSYYALKMPRLRAHFSGFLRGRSLQFYHRRRCQRDTFCPLTCRSRSTCLRAHLLPHGLRILVRRSATACLPRAIFLIARYLSYVPLTLPACCARALPGVGFVTTHACALTHSVVFDASTRRFLHARRGVLPLDIWRMT